MLFWLKIAQVWFKPILINHWFFKYLYEKDHCDRDCPFVEINCRFTGCEERFQRQHQQKHEESCSYKEDVCGYCNEIIKVSMIEVSYFLFS